MVKKQKNWEEVDDRERDMRIKGGVRERKMTLEIGKSWCSHWKGVTVRDEGF